MRLGIDIGGTHTDGVLLKDKEILTTTKLPTANNNLTKVIIKTCRRLIEGYNSPAVDQITLSTTLAANTIITKDYQKTGLLLIPGPGLKETWTDFPVKEISGYTNHRGEVVEQIARKEVLAAVDELLSIGVEKIGVCAKFSPRNPQQELKVKKIIDNNFSRLDNISLSHQLTPNLNFPRRQVTTYFNRAIYEAYQEFSTKLQAGFKELNLRAPLYLLKADGGTMSLNKAEKRPVETINSGPSASIMGILTLTQQRENILGLDIGGTTTDISLFIDRAPLFEPDGIKINNYNSSLRGLYNYSIGCGGDSLVRLKDNKLKIGPQRKGPAAALGGPAPTPTDALILLDEMELGSKTKAYQSLKPIAEKLALKPQKTAQKIIEKFCQKIQTEVAKVIKSWENQPVYTINELLTDYKLNLDHLVGIGGPAQALVPKLAAELNLGYTIPQEAEIANAIGAAAARPTKAVKLYADTAQSYYQFSQSSQREKISSNFTLAEAKKTALNQLTKAGYREEEIEITNTERFNLVRGFKTTGKILAVTAQIKPGLEVEIDN